MSISQVKLFECDSLLKLELDMNKWVLERWRDVKVKSSSVSVTNLNKCDNKGFYTKYVGTIRYIDIEKDRVKLNMEFKI
jgi:hypothetical protein